MKNKIYIAIICAFSIVFAVSSGFLIKHYYDSAKQAEMYDNLIEVVETEPEETQEPMNYSEEKTFIPEYQELYLQNNDMVGWIKVEDTKINYPVMQSKDNPNFYLKHGFDKAYTDYGCPYVQENCDMELPSDNIIIYGHHMPKFETSVELLDPMAEVQKESEVEEEKPAENSTDENAALLAKLLSNPETAALLKALAKTI